MFQRRRFLLPLLMCFAAHGAAGAEARIVPGQQIGGATLGMTRRQMHEALGKSAGAVRLDGGIVREDWLSATLAPKSYVEKSLYFKHDFVTVYFRDNHAIQIEASSAAFKTREGLSPASSALKFQERYRGYARIDPHFFTNPDPGGCPATKHFVRYEDAVTQGLAWRYGVWGNLSPDLDPERRLEMVIVHRSGEPVFVDPDGGVRLVWKKPPSDLMENYPAK